MKPYEFMRIYHPKMGQFVYEHKGSGIIVDNIFKSLKSVALPVFNKFTKPLAKKALESGISHAGDKLGKKAAEKSGDLIMKKLANRFNKSKPQYPMTTTPVKQAEESADMILNRLISGSGIRRRRKIM